MSLRYGQCFTVGWLDRVFFIYVTIYCRGFLLTSIDSSLTPGSMIWLSPIVEQTLADIALLLSVAVDGLQMALLEHRQPIRLTDLENYR